MAGSKRNWQKGPEQKPTAKKNEENDRKMRKMIEKITKTIAIAVVAVALLAGTFAISSAKANSPLQSIAEAQKPGAPVLIAKYCSECTYYGDEECKQNCEPDPLPLYR